jgi:hypothetical protein
MTNSFIPHDFQQDGINWILSRLGAGLFLPPGLGKTATTLSAIKLLLQSGDIERVLVVAPLRVAQLVWAQEAKKWEEFKDLKVVTLHGKDKDNLVRNGADIYVINPEGLEWFFRVHIGLIRSFNFMLVCDESTLFKNHSSLRFKMIKYHLKYFKRRVILTGTPAPNGLMQLWSQMYILDEGDALGKFITHFRNKFFIKSFDGFSYLMRDGSEQEIYDAVKHLVMHKSSDEIELPGIHYNNINVILPDKAMRQYKDMKDSFIATHEGSTVAAFSAASQGFKLKQIANGMVYDENQKPVRIHSKKLDALEELVSELGGRPLLVVYEYNHDLNEIKTRINAPHIGGGVQAGDIITKWNNGQLPVLLLQPLAGGHGLNLQTGGCHDVVWYSITYDLELYLQVNARVYRQGVKNPVTIHHIVALNTIDESIALALEGKADVQNALMQAVLR